MTSKELKAWLLRWGVAIFWWS